MNTLKDMVAAGKVVEQMTNEIQLKHGLTYLCDGKRHLICIPYSIPNLHIMANSLNIKQCWFHKDHYDIPKRRIVEITSKCKIVSSKELVRIINGIDVK